MLPPSRLSCRWATASRAAQTWRRRSCSGARRTRRRCIPRRSWSRCRSRRAVAEEVAHRHRGRQRQRGEPGWPGRRVQVSLVALSRVLVSMQSRSRGQSKVQMTTARSHGPARLLLFVQSSSPPVAGLGAAVTRKAGVEGVVADTPFSAAIRATQAPLGAGIEVSWSASGPYAGIVLGLMDDDRRVGELAGVALLGLSLAWAAGPVRPRARRARGSPSHRASRRPAGSHPRRARRTAAFSPRTAPV